MSSDTKQKKKHMKVVRPKLRLFRAKEPVLSVFMWGVNHSINELQHISVPVMLMPDDFKSHSKVRVDNHLFNKENMPSHFKFKEYCPLVFRNLRERFGIHDEDYMDSLTKCPPVEVPANPQLTSSWDKLYVVKKIDSEDVAMMHKIVKDYHQYIVECHADTLLPHFLGMYRVTVNDNETYMVVMRNIFSPRLNVHKKYDLKGSTVQREASHKEKAKDLPTLKDNDFVNEGIKICLGADRKESVMKQLHSDVEFLTKMNLMDYSLLVGIHDLELADLEMQEAVESEENGFTESEEELVGGANSGVGGANASVGGASLQNTSTMDSVPTPPDSPLTRSMNPPDFNGVFDDNLERFAIRSSEGGPRREIYFLALIDILTHYGMKKRSAQAAKTVKYGAGAEISTAKPEQYARRFIEFVEKSLT